MKGKRDGCSKGSKSFEERKIRKEEGDGTSGRSEGRTDTGDDEKEGDGGERREVAARRAGRRFGDWLGKRERGQSRLFVDSQLEQGSLKGICVHHCVPDIITTTSYGIKV